MKRIVCYFVVMTHLVEASIERWVVHEPMEVVEPDLLAQRTHEHVLEEGLKRWQQCHVRREANTQVVGRKCRGDVDEHL